MKTKRKLSTFDKIVLIVNVIVTMVLLLSYLAPYIDPRNCIFIAILGFGYQALLVFNLVFILYWCISIRLFVLISFISILLGFNIIKNNFGFHSSGIIGKKNTQSIIRIMTLNTHGFIGTGKLEGDSTQNTFFQLEKAKHPDIITLQEYPFYKRDSPSINQSLKNAIKSDYYYFNPFTTSGNFTDGNAIFSKFPILNSGVVPFPKVLELRAIFADIQYRAKIIRVYCIHLAAVMIDPKEKSSYLNGNITFDKSSFIASKLSAAFIQRSYQVAVIRRHMQKCPYPYILAGDFNDTPISYAVNELGAGLKNAFVEKGSGLGVTYHSKFPKLQIDYIMATSQFNVINYEAIITDISDHYPIISDLALKGL